MAKKTYIRDDEGKARVAEKLYFRDDEGKARKAKKLYIRDANGLARLVFAVSGGTTHGHTYAYSSIPGTDAHKVYCSSCGETLIESAVCTSGSAMYLDSTYHYHNCIYCGRSLGATQHSYDSSGKCVCGATNPSGGDSTHTHNYSTYVGIEQDGDRAWAVYKCDCGATKREYV